MLEEKLKVGILLKNTVNGTKQNGLVKDISHYVKDYKLDIFLGPEFLFTPQLKIYSKSGKNKLLRKLVELTTDSGALVIPGSTMWYDKEYCYNAAPILSQGRILGVYHKKVDGGSQNMASCRKCKKKWLEGKKHGIYAWKGYRLGVEICADQGLLQNHLKDNGECLLDFYFLVSCGAAFREDFVPVKEGGYALYADGCGCTESKVLRRSDKVNERSGIKDVRFENLDLTEAKEDRLDIYELVVNNVGKKA